MKFKFVLQPKQLELAKFAQASGRDAATVIGYGGALGGGKSGAARRIMIERRYKNPGTRGIIIRRVWSDLRDNHIEPFFREFPELREHYAVGNKEIILPNSGGSSIGFLHAETAGDVDRQFAGPEYFDIMVDQAEQFTEAELMKIRSRNRWPGGGQGVCKFFLFFNPGGPGMEYLRRVFWTRQYRDNETPSDYRFIHAFGWDNYQWFTHLMSQGEFYKLSSDERFNLFIADTQYGKHLDSLPPSLRLGHLLGSFEHFSGQYFAGAWDEQKCVLTPQQVQQIVRPWWTRWMAQDWGFGDHDCHLWFAAGKLSPELWVKYFGGSCDWPMNVCVVYRELVVAARAEADLATDIVSLTPAFERKTMQRFFLSQDAFGQRAKQSGANTVGQQFAETMSRHGLPQPEPADQDRVNGWRFLYACFRQAQLRGCNFDQERAQQGPALFVSADCAELISSIPMAIRDDKNPEDVMRVAGVLWEDCTDALRYGAKSMMDPQSKAPREVRAKEVYNSIQGNDGDAMTARAMAMRKFEVDNPARPVLGRPRWRQPDR